MNATPATTAAPRELSAHEVAVIVRAATGRPAFAYVHMSGVDGADAAFVSVAEGVAVEDGGAL